MNHHTTADFWDCYGRLPESVQRLADDKYNLLRIDPWHPRARRKGVPMVRSTALLAIAIFASTGCQTPTAGTPMAAPGVSPISNAAVGHRCVVHLKAPPNSSTQYEGTVTAFDAEKVVMSTPVVIGRTENSVPVLGRLPWVGRYFRSVGIGRQVMNTDVEIRRSEIRSLDVSSGTADNAEQPDGPERPVAEVSHNG